MTQGGVNFISISWSVRFRCLSWVQVVFLGVILGSNIGLGKERQKGEMPVKGFVGELGSMGFNPAWDLLRN